MICKRAAPVAEKDPVLGKSSDWADDRRKGEHEFARGWMERIGGGRGCDAMGQLMERILISLPLISMHCLLPSLSPVSASSSPVSFVISQKRYLVQVAAFSLSRLA